MEYLLYEIYISPGKSAQKVKRISLSICDLDNFYKRIIYWVQNDAFIAMRMGLNIECQYHIETVFLGNFNKWHYKMQI